MILFYPIFKKKTDKGQSDNNTLQSSCFLFLDKHYSFYTNKSLKNSLISHNLYNTASRIASLNSFPVLKYINADLSKMQAVKENKGKSGVYRWINNVNGNTYIGSSVNLGRRFRNYFSFNYITDTKCNMLIHKALIKYGYSNFTLEVLEYCELNVVISREQYYMDTLKPSYNVLKVAGSSLGFKHSKTILAKPRRKFTPEH